MITIDDILQKIEKLDDALEIKKAYQFAEKHLEGLIRKNNDSVLNHSLEVANILLDLNVDKTTIISALLHETILQDEKLLDEIEDAFGVEVARVVLSVSKVNHLEMVDDSMDSALYLRKVMVGLSEDVRVLFIKLADRLHNMRTMDVCSVTHQKKVANETLSVLVPIAHRLGINSIKSELENLCLYYLKPDVYNDILEKLNHTVEELNSYLIAMKESISKELTLNNLNFEIKGRVKSVYSIYNKLENGKKWEDIYDILALRVFVEKESECYQTIGIIHSKYRPVPNRFKDYIAIPKENMYQSLHTTVVGEGGYAYEVQVRTYEMDEIAEKGIASHWSYKEKGSKKIQTMMEQKLELYRSIIESSKESEESEFKGVIDNNILSDVIYVYTPKGDVVELPKDSTPIDFAYRIHSKVGDTMVGAIVNDVMVPISSALKDGDVIKIMTNASACPNKEWLSFVKTTQAKNKIKSYFSKTQKDEYIQKGKSILEKEIRKHRLSISEVLNADNISKICESLELKDLDDIYLSVGTLRYTANYLINFVSGKELVDTLITKTPKYNISNTSDILVDGKSLILTHLAKCCSPVKGDDIVGIITKNDGIAIHRKSCVNTKEEAKIVDVSWNYDVIGSYPAAILITVSAVKDKTNDFLAVLTNLKISIHSINKESDDLYKIDVWVKDKDEIDKLIKNIGHLRYVRKVQRK